MTCFLAVENWPSRLFTVALWRVCILSMAQEAAPSLWYREVWLWCACTSKLGLSCWDFVELPSPVGLPWCLRQQRIACNAGDLSSIPGSGISPGEGNGYPLQYSCLENPMDWGAWWAAVQGVAESRTRLRDWHFQAKVSTGHPDPLRYSIFGTEKSGCDVHCGGWVYHAWNLLSFPILWVPLPSCWKAGRYVFSWQPGRALGPALLECCFGLLPVSVHTDPITYLCVGVHACVCVFHFLEQKTWF